MAVLNEKEIVIPRSWNDLARSRLPGLTMILGASDSGKSTLAHWLHRRLRTRTGGALAFLDGDPGQSVLGPPATITLALTGGAGSQNRQRVRRWRWFVEATTPRRHEFRLLAGVSRLVGAAFRRSAGGIIYDTTGFIDPRHGGAALKLAKIDLLGPGLVIAIRRGDELEPILAPLRMRRGIRIIELESPPEVRRRSVAERRNHRRQRFAAYFAGAACREVSVARFAHSPGRLPGPDQLVAFENSAGFTAALGIALETGGARGTTAVLTPLRSFSGIDTIRFAALAVSPATFEDRPADERPGPGW